MYCCCEKIRPNLGHVDVELSDIEQNTKNNDICSTNKKKNININININNNNINNNVRINGEITNKNINQNDNNNTILSFQRIFVNDSNIDSSNYNNKIKNENILNNKPINNTSRIDLNQGKIINITKSENCKFNCLSNNQNCSIIMEEKKKNNQKESLYKYNLYKNNTIFSKMTDNFSYRDNTSDFTNLIYLLNNRTITEEEILSAPKLKLFGESTDFFYGKEIFINAAGLINQNEKIIKKINSSTVKLSTKILSTNNNLNNYDNQTNSIIMPINENKGITFFGQNINYNNNKNFVSINYNRAKFNDYNKIDIFFYIYYLRETKKYYLKPNNNSIMFLRLKPKTGYLIKQGEFLSFDYIILMIKRNKSGYNNYLSIDYNQENFIFKDEDYINKNKYIKIGRDKKCDIIIENRKSVSRLNAIIKYNNKIEEWEIYDGDENNKESLNGISVLLRNEYEISDNCEIEFLGQRFKIQLIDDNKFDTN